MSLQRTAQLFEDLCRLPSDEQRSELERLELAEPEVVAQVRAMLARRMPDLGIEDSQTGAADDTTPTAPPEEAVRRFGDFELIAELGKGGAGAVYLARESGLRRPVALKILHPSLMADTAGDLHHEIQILSGVEHPNIVPIYHSDSVNGQAFFTMPYIRQDLAAYAKSVDLSVREAAKCIRTLAMAAAFAHSKSIIHRDIKPGNVLVDVFNHTATSNSDKEEQQSSPGAVTYFLADFGIAKSLTNQDATGATRHGIVGTPAYMSPEQVKGETVDVETDVYSLGAVLYFLLTGQAPFPGTVPAEVMRHVRMETPVRPRTLNQNVPRDLETICLKCLSKEPDGRYPSAHELADDLARYLEDRPIAARRASLLARTWQRIRRRPVHFGLAGTVVLLLLVTGVFGNHRLSLQRQQREITGRVRLKYNDALDDLHSGRWEQSLASADQAEAMYSSVSSADSNLKTSLQFLRKNVQMVLTLSELRDRVLVVNVGTSGQPGDKEGLSDLSMTESERYHIEFAKFGIDLKTLQPGEVFQRIRESEICEELVKALDNWSMIERGRGARLAILAIAQEADQVKSRKQLREVVMQGEPDQLVELTNSISDLSEYPPGSLEFAAVELERLGKRTEAIDLLERAVIIYPGDLWVNFVLGSLYQRAGQPEKEAVYRRVSVALRPEIPELHLNLGAALYDRGQLKEALAEFRRAAELRPDYAAAFENVGQCLAQLGQSEAAESAFRRAKELNASSSLESIGLGIHYLNVVGDPVSAQEHFQFAIDNGHDSPETRVGLGMALERQGTFDEAIRQFQMALGRKPEYFQAWERWLVVLRKQEKSKELTDLKDQLKRSLELDSDEVMHLRYAFLSHELGDVETAVREYKRVLELNPKNSDAHVQLGEVYKEQTEFDMALNHLKVAAEQLPEARHSVYFLPNAVEDLQRLVDLEQDVSRIIEGSREPVSVREQIEFARLLYYHRQFAAAANHFQMAFAEEPGLIADPVSGHRFNAACCAALAGTGANSPELSLDEMTKERQRARAWLEEERDTVLSKYSGDAVGQLRFLPHFLRDRDFVGIREPSMLKSLPPEEAAQWHGFWNEIRDLVSDAADQLESRRDGTTGG